MGLPQVFKPANSKMSWNFYWTYYNMLIISSYSSYVFDSNDDLKKAKKVKEKLLWGYLLKIRYSLLIGNKGGKVRLRGRKFTAKQNNSCWIAFWLMSQANETNNHPLRNRWDFTPRGSFDIPNIRSQVSEKNLKSMGDRDKIPLYKISLRRISNFYSLWLYFYMLAVPATFWSWVHPSKLWLDLL